jgi:hypothetical protein
VLGRAFVLATLLAQGKLPPSAPPLPVKPLVQPVESARAKSTETEPSKLQPSKVQALPTTEDRIANYTLFLTIFTGVLAIVAIYQGYQLRTTVAAMERQETLTGKSVDAAVATIAKMDEIARRQLRAYILAANAKFEIGRVPSERYVEVTMQNYGRTPALNVTSVFGVGVREWPLCSQLPEPDQGIKKAVAPLPPGRDSVNRLPISRLNDWEEKELREGRAGVYCWGTVNYVDIFGCPHQTTVRMVCEGESIHKGFMHECEEGSTAT